MLLNQLTAVLIWVAQERILGLTYSNRKWAESMAASRIDGPTRNQVCLRAGQSVGRVQDCYMKQEDDGDAIVGRTLALLKIDADEFDVLPPH